MSRGNGKGRSIPVADLTKYLPFLRSGAEALLQLARRNRDKGGWTDCRLRFEESQVLHELGQWIELGAPGPGPDIPGPESSPAQE